MKQSNFAESIIKATIGGIYIGISSVIKIFFRFMLRLFFRTTTVAGCEQPNDVSQPLVEVVDYDNNKLADPEVTGESNIKILISIGKAGFTEAKSSPLFRGLRPNNISILCHYWCSNKFD